MHERLLGRGYAVADLSYRLSHEAVYPCQLHDLQSAIRWTRAFAADLNIDPTRCAIFGESAGGHLATLAALATTPPDGSAALQAAIAWYPPTDLTFADGPPEPDDPAIPLFGGMPADVPEVARLGSPVHQIRSTAPPLLCVHGTADQNVPLSHSQALVDGLRALGNRAELVAVPDAKHGFEGCDDIGALIDLSVDFLDDALVRGHGR